MYKKPLTLSHRLQQVWRPSCRPFSLQDPYHRPLSLQTHITARPPHCRPSPCKTHITADPLPARPHLTESPLSLQTLSLSSDTHRPSVLHFHRWFQRSIIFGIQGEQKCFFFYAFAKRLRNAIFFSRLSSFQTDPFFNAVQIQLLGSVKGGRGHLTRARRGATGP